MTNVSNGFDLTESVIGKSHIISCAGSLIYMSVDSNNKFFEIPKNKFIKPPADRFRVDFVIIDNATDDAFYHGIARWNSSKSAINLNAYHIPNKGASVTYRFQFTYIEEI